MAASRAQLPVASPRVARRPPIMPATSAETETAELTAARHADPLRDGDERQRVAATAPYLER